ncbi:TetR/AcrR family transcriptional regulator [Streptomyces sp. RerS4]|uniref:TetR/AcrR family transcriptional regulator n=1 Tax=Streptomyces sp. RerS4 TaxID=2942449 RepID=UPI00201BB16B|nr:TetR/AcrR family transcriptional regulator [Streptomyces sp. RerS4]UQX05433.1 TetR/AcrR family transcriptional regulator [Streptomyces sp. RerS4]
MKQRSSQTRQALVRATAELIADGRVADAGLVNICHRAGVTRGALYHHFPSTASLAAVVYDEARTRAWSFTEEAFDGGEPDAPKRFLVALGAAMGNEKVVRAGMQLASDGSDGRPCLRDELLAMVRRRVVATHQDTTRSSDDVANLADLAVVVAAGIESLGRSDPAWWEGKTSTRLWETMRPLFESAALDRQRV